MLDKQARILKEARECIGKPYIWGGNLPENAGTDCSGLVQYCFGKAGISLPRTSKEQYLVEGSSIYEKEELEPGDLVFNVNMDGKISHVMIYSGNGNVIEAQKDGTLIMEHKGWNWEGHARRVKALDESPVVFYRAVCGSYRDIENAKTIVEELKELGYGNAFVSRYDIR